MELLIKQSKYGVGILLVSIILVSGHSLPITSSPEGNIALIIKQTLTNTSTDDVTKMMKEHLIQMQLMNRDDVWANWELENIGHKLLPRNLNGPQLADFVDKMAYHAAKNPYLHNFLNQASGPDFEELKRRVDLEGGLFFPDVVSFAMVLDRLTLSMEEDWRVLQACHHVWSKSFSNNWKHGSFSKLIKYVSIRKPVEMLIEAMKTKKVDPNFGQYLAPINILEAKAVDIRYGYLDNAETAWTLTRHIPGGSKDPATGSGPATFSQDGKTLELHFPLGKEWADLYHTWNMAFVSRFQNFPYYIAKLLIPSVSDYQEAPEGYLHSRVLALYATLNWNGPATNMNWSSRAVTKKWGQQNAKSSQGYELKIAQLKPTSLFGSILDKFHSIASYKAKWFVGAVSDIKKWF